MKTRVCMLGCTLALGGLFAQDMAANPAPDPAALLAAQADAAAKLLPGVPADASQSAEETVRANLAKLGVAVGYDRKRHAIIAIGTAQVLVKDPANDTSFMRIRSAKAQEAYLNAKVEVMQIIYANLSAVDRLSVMGNIGEVKPTGDYTKKCKEIEAKRLSLVKKLESLDKAEAALLKGATLGDQFNAILDGLAQKLDSKFGADKIAAEKRALCDSLKAECEAMKTECEALERQAKLIITPPVPSTTVESSKKNHLKMPLLGSSVLTQAESWDETEQIYTVSMAIVWSPKMQENAVHLLHGDFR